jgi:hypothetical protein
MNKLFFGLLLGVSSTAFAQFGGNLVDTNFCNAPVDTAFILSDGGPNLVPATPAPFRRSITVCNSAENAGAPVIKCGVGGFVLLDGGYVVIDGGNPAVGGVCWHDGGPSCGSTTTWSELDGGPILADAGCRVATLIDGGPDCAGAPFGGDGGPCLVDGGGYDAGFADAGCPLVDAGALLDGGFIDAGYICAPPTPQCDPAWTLTGAWNRALDGGPTFNDGGPCLADAGYCLVDGGPVSFDGGILLIDGGIIYQDGGPYLGNTMPGDPLKVGDCITYPVGTGGQILCIGTGSLSTTVGVEAKECR